MAESLKREPLTAGAVFLAFLLLAVLIFIPVLEKEGWLRLESAGRSIQESISAETGFKLSFSSLSPALLRGVCVTNFEARDRRDRLVMHADRIYLYYDIWGLIQKKQSSVISELRLEDVSLKLDSEDLRLLTDLSRRMSSGGKSTLPAFTISAANLSLELEDLIPGGLLFDLNSLHLAGGLPGPEVEARAQGSALLRRAGSLGSLSIPLEASGLVARDISAGRLSLAFSVSSPLFDVNTQRFSLSFNEQELELRKIEDKAPVDAFLHYDIARGQLSASLNVENYAPERSVRLKGSLAGIKPWLSLPFNGQLSVTSPVRDFSRIRYSLNLQAGLENAPLKGFKRVNIRASGDTREVNVQAARLETEVADFGYSGSFRFHDLAPDGYLSASSSSEKMPYDLRLRLFGSGGHYAAVADQVAVDGIVLNDLLVDADLHKDSVDFNLSVLLPEEEVAAEGEGGRSLASAKAAAAQNGGAGRYSGEASSEAGFPRIKLEGSYEFGQGPMLDVALLLDSADLKSLSPLFETLAPGSSQLLSSFLVDGQIYLRSDFRRFSYSTSNFLVVSRSMPNSYALLSLSGNDKGLTLKQGEVVSGSYSGQVSGDVDFSTSERVDLKLALLYRETTYNVQGSIAGSDVFLSGDYGLKASLRQKDGRFYFSLASGALPLSVGGLRLLISLDSDGYFANPGDFRLNLSYFRLEAEGAPQIPALTCTGFFNPSGASLSDLVLKDQISELRGQAVLGYDLGQSPPPLSLEAKLSGADSESYALSASCRPDAGGLYNLNGTLNFAGSPLVRLIKTGVKGSLGGQASVSGPVDSLALAFRAKVNNGSFNGESFSLDLSGTEKDGKIHIGSGDASYRGFALDGLNADFDLATAAASASGGLHSIQAAEKKDAASNLSLSFSAEGRSLGAAPAAPAAASALPAAGASSASVQTAAPASDQKATALAATQSTAASGVTPDDDSLAARFARYELGGQILNLDYGGHKVADWPFKVVLDSGRIAFVGGTKSELSVSYNPDGSFAARSEAPMPVAFNAAGRISGGDITAALSDLSGDLTPLGSFINSRDFRLDSGTVAGSITIQGRLSDPDFSGSLMLSNAILAVPSYVKGSIGPINAPVIFEDKSITCSVPSLDAGNAKVSFDGSAVMNGWLPTDFKAKIKTLDKSWIDLDTVILGITVKGKASADIVLTANPSVLNLSGDILLEKTDVVINPAQMGGGGEQEGSPTAVGLDFTLSFGPGVGIYSPSKDLPIFSAFATPASSAKIVLDPETGDLTCTGALVLRGGEIFYIQRDFYLKNGRITFNETKDKFDPLVTLVAERHERLDNRQVLITLTAEDQPISKFAPKLSSNDSSLSQAQIVNLLGTGLLGSTNSSNSVDWKSAAVSSTEFIPQLNVAKSFENKVREAFGLDVFFFQSQVFQRWLVNMADQSSSTSSSSNGLASYLDGTSLYVGKYVSDDIFLHASASIDKDPLYRTGLLRLDSEFGVDFETPFGRLIWSISPPQDSEDILLINQSLSLSWKIQL